MLNMNNCQICGNLVRDPEINNTSSGKAVATMTVAVNRYFVNQNGEKQECTSKSVASMGRSHRKPAAERDAGVCRGAVQQLLLRQGR